MDSLERAMVKTLCWFAVFEYPLTTFEVWKWLWSPDRTYILADVLSTFSESPWLRERLQMEDGFMALVGTPPIKEQITERQRRFVDAMRKFRKVRRAARWFARAPGVEGVAAVNTLAWFHTRPESDIDLFVLTKPDAVWSGRFWSVLPFLLSRKRPGESGEDAFCFSFFSSTDALDLSSLRLSGSDPYLAYWVSSVVPVVGNESIWQRFWDANHLTRSGLPHIGELSHAWELIRPRRWGEGYFLGTRIENFLRRVQEKKLPAVIRTMANRDSRVIVNDRMLKFHDNDRREEYRERFDALVKTYVA